MKYKYWNAIYPDVSSYKNPYSQVLEPCRNGRKWQIKYTHISLWLRSGSIYVKCKQRTYGNNLTFFFTINQLLVKVLTAAIGQTP